MKVACFPLLFFIILDTVSRAEHGVVTELSPHDDPLDLVKYYQNVRAQMKGPNSGVESSLKALRNKISKEEDLHIDTYNAHWRWHATYFQCEDEYRDMLKRLQHTLDQGNPLTIAELVNVIRERDCATWAPMREQELFVITELLQGRSKESGLKWDLTSLKNVVENIGSSYNASAEAPPPLYYAATAELLLALGNEVEAVKTVHIGLEKYKDESNLIDILFRILVDPKNYDFKHAWSRKITPIALSGVSLLRDCQWVKDLGKYDTWDEALNMVDSAFEGCHPKEVAKDIKYVVRAFLYTGKFQWKTAQSYIDSVLQSSVFPMVAKLQELRTSMITEILMRSTSYRGQGSPNLEAWRQKANQAASNASVPIKSSQISNVKMPSKEPKTLSQEKRIEAPVSSSAANLPRPEDQMNVKLAILAKTTQGDRRVGREAETDFHEFLKARDWWRAREAFRVASYNLYFSDVQTLQEDWDRVLGWNGRSNDLHLDPVIMRFGWRTEFAKAQKKHWTNKKEAISQIRTTPLANSSQVLDQLKLAGLIDPRPGQCGKMLDVAEVFAQAGQLSRGLQIANTECSSDLKIEDEARILQAFVEGLYDEKSAVDLDLKLEIANALKYVIENFERGTSDWRWGAAALSLRKVLSSRGAGGDKVLAPLRPLPVTEQRGKPRSLLLIKERITVDDLNKTIDNDRSPPEELVNYIPVIEKIFQAQQRNGRHAIYLYADSMRNVLTKLRDGGRALAWWELALVTCSDRTRFDHHHVEYDKLKIDVVKELETLPGGTSTIFSKLLDRIEEEM